MCKIIFSILEVNSVVCLLFLSLYFYNYDEALCLQRQFIKNLRSILKNRPILLFVEVFFSIVRELLVIDIS